MENFTISRTEETEDKWTFEVGLNSCSYKVVLDKDYLADLADESVEPEVLIRASFEFLLEREPASSILAEFEMPVIQDYFPEYETVMRKRLNSQ